MPNTRSWVWTMRTRTRSWRVSIEPATRDTSRSKRFVRWPVGRVEIGRSLFVFFFQANVQKARRPLGLDKRASDKSETHFGNNEHRARQPIKVLGPNQTVLNRWCLSDTAYISKGCWMIWEMRWRTLMAKCNESPKKSTRSSRWRRVSKMSSQYEHCWVSALFGYWPIGSTLALNSI